ncbi:MAG: SoxR reducing system RseC family protein [Tannerellaceae bacterium]|jgi:sigma-E factor negative regulatory protein RseC|nr:SoxR reducing system RseC family protein [Tannerellaceae bacterium]
MEDTVGHCGIIERIEGNSVYVKIVQQSACAGCQAKVVCATASGKKEQIIEVTDYSGTFHANESVILKGTERMELQAVGLAFILPLALLVGAIVLGAAMQWQESASALAGLLLLLPYYLILYFFRSALKKKFVFTIKKINP